MTAYLPHFLFVTSLALGALSAWALVSRARACREAERANAILADVVESMHSLAGGIVVWDEEDRLAMCDSQFRKVYARSAQFLVAGARFEDVIRQAVAVGQFPAALGREEEFIREVVDSHRRPNGCFERQLPDGRWILINERRTASGRTVGIRADITALKKAIEEAAAAHAEVARLALHDPLTGLPNRRSFHDRLAQALETGGCALLVVDLDGFKPVNDAHGHEAGDRLLVAIAERLQACAGPAGFVARLGGDEFAVILPAAEVARAAAEEIVRAVSAPVTLGDVTVAIGASVGLAEARPGETGDALLRRADGALYDAKRRGRRRVCDAPALVA
ncbi:diguanylate cyclase domain-containing protein [Salinarimonas sp.]|uniref:diguanylate cyclase domain-containing protein n=1 Tax=Salinarimonas sp. TaxID=2766526 RepID=UPI00391BFB05